MHFGITRESKDKRDCDYWVEIDFNEKYKSNFILYYFYHISVLKEL